MNASIATATGFWCHEASPLIHPVGWARRVGHQIEASKEYHRRCEEDRLEESDCTADMFPEYVQPPGTFSAGMKIEAVDPLNLASVCVATVMQVSFQFQQWKGCQNGPGNWAINYSQIKVNPVCC